MLHWFNITICRSPFMMKIGNFYGQRFSQKWLGYQKTAYSFIKSKIVCLKQQVFSGSMLPEHTFKGRYGKLLECRNRHHYPWILWNLVETYLAISCRLPWAHRKDWLPMTIISDLLVATATRHVDLFSVHTSKQNFAASVCWCKSDMKCVNLSSISTQAQDSLLIRKTMKRTLAELTKTRWWHEQFWVNYYFFLYLFYADDHFDYFGSHLG